MRRLVSLLLPLTLVFLVPELNRAFTIAPRVQRVSQPVLYSSSSSSSTETPAAPSASSKTKTLGLLTFDLDDTLYPVAPVIQEANEAFAAAMARFGYEGIEPDDIVATGRAIREEIAETQGPTAAAILTHTEIRELAIRREMEKITLKRKLKACADDWATPVSDLSPIVVNHAKKWSKEAVSESVVQAVLNSWLMERHHASERHLYPELLDVLKQIKAEHPSVILGAVTDGRANPLLMTFTLAPYFDFCMSWEDDQGNRQKFFQELGSVEGNAQLKWIYDAALEKYHELEQVQDKMVKSDKKVASEDKVWIHVGDDLAYDVGGAHTSGAKTVYCELADQYKQTARHRFDDLSKAQPAWSTTMQDELEQRKIMNEAAVEYVDETIHFLTRLPEAINNILEPED